MSFTCSRATASRSRIVSVFLGSLRFFAGAGSSVGGLLPGSCLVPELLAKLPVQARLPQKIDTPFTTLPWSALEQSRSLQDPEFGVNGRHSRRIPELLRQVLDADHAVAVRDRYSNLKTVLASEERSGALS
jgi:hypothetical protein